MVKLMRMASVLAVSVFYLSGCVVSKSEYKPDDAILQLIPRDTALVFLQSTSTLDFDEEGVLTISMGADANVKTTRVPYQCMKIEAYKSTPGVDTDFRTQQFMGVRYFGLENPVCHYDKAWGMVGPFHDLSTVRRVVESMAALGAKLKD